MSFIFPLISLPAYEEPLININKINTIDTILPYSTVQNDIIPQSTQSKNIDYESILILIYALISTILFINFVIELMRLIYKTHSKTCIKKDTYSLIIDKNIQSPFSFMHYIFVNNTEKIAPLVIEHEKAHIRQYHTLDLIFLQTVSSFLWINPVIYLLKKELIAQHEYFADKKVLQNIEMSDIYLQQFLLQAQNHFNYQLTSKFNNSLTHKRIKMMKKTKINEKKQFSYILLTVITVFIAGIYACSNTDTPLINQTEIGIKQTQDNSKNKTNNKRIKSLIPQGLPVQKENITGTTDFGFRVHPILKVKKMHTGIDFEAERGTKIYATADGIVKSTEHRGGYGNCIIIEHAENYSTLYAHLKSFNVKEGDRINAGDVIGFVGSTGFSTRPQLHYEVRLNNKQLNPKNFLE